MPVGANAKFTKYFTMPDFHAETEKLKLAGWLRLIWDEVNPVDYMWEMVTRVFVRPDGWHYHRTRLCPMLRDGDFEELGYKEVELTDKIRKKYHGCSCVAKSDEELEGVHL